MIIKLHRAGRSFKGAIRYLTHDPGADTSKRVAWTHTLNLAHDHIASAVDEMLWTARSVDLLKREARVSTGGSKLERPVKHFSLSWHTSETPDREHMIETVQKYLEHMGWADRQAILTAHNDTAHPHVHVVLNVVSPEDGRTINTGFEKRRSQDFALEYEREQNRIHCDERLKPVSEREKSPTREAWQKIGMSKLEHDRAEIERLLQHYDEVARNDPSEANDFEQRGLKVRQRQEREEFFMGGKQAYAVVCKMVGRQVRQEFRHEWRDYYKATREGHSKEELSVWKQDIIQRQNGEYELRAKEECATLRTSRDEIYKDLLAGQRHERDELKRAQAHGEQSQHIFLDELRSGQRDLILPAERKPTNVRKDFKDAAAEVGEPMGQPRHREMRGQGEFSSAQPQPENFKIRGGIDALGGIGLGALGAIATIGENLFDGFFGGSPPPADDKPAPVVHQRDETVDVGMAAVTTQAETEARQTEAQALQAFWDSRREKRRARD